MDPTALASRTFLFHFCHLSLFLLFVGSADDEPSTPPCSPFSCGNISHISFPFAEINNPECGLIPMGCFDNSVAKIQSLDGRGYLVKSISNSGHSFTVQDLQLTWHLNEKRCDPISIFKPPTFPDFIVNIPSPFITIFICESDYHFNHSRYQNIRSYNRCTDSILYFSRPHLQHEPQENEIPEDIQSNCSSSSHRLLKMPNDSEWVNFDLLSSVAAGFSLQWVIEEDCVACQNSGGQCGLDVWRNLSCYCQDGTSGKYCTSGRKARTWLKVVVGSSAAFGTVLLTGLLLVVCVRMSKLKITTRVWKNSKRSRDFENFIENHRTQMPERYSYSDIRKMTNHLKSKLGEGGFGSVFKGQLLDGRPVAVKILSDSKGTGEDFINEVAAISRTSHVNIVRLVGFCFQGSHRALVYEFMVNGSLEKIIFDKDPKHSPLGWEKLFQIALGIARGLEYLHRGCNMRILHFDIKPHNILLDQDFCPKISDFGLAKLCPDKESIVSMTAVRGTLGYIAPEVVCRSLGGVSQKSDVYSYGMLLLEMVGGRKNIDAGVENTSEIYFPDWIYNRINKPGDLLLDEVMEETDDELVRKLILVGLWCIQTRPMDRPTMSKVVEMLEGNLQVVQMPPKPFLYSHSEAE